MKTVEIETMRALGMPLDWAAAKAMGKLDAIVVLEDGAVTSEVSILLGLVPKLVDMKNARLWEPSVDWLVAGAIAEEQGITSGPWDTSPFMAYYGFPETVSSSNPRIVAKTPTIAIVRAFVLRVLGPTFDVPAILVE